MPEIELPFAVQQGESSNLQNSQERLINMFAEIEVSGGKSKVLRRPRPGLNTRLAISGSKRGIEKFGAAHYLVVDDTLYSYDGTTTTTLGTLDSADGPVTMIRNDNDQIGISDGVKLYVWDGSALSITATPSNVGHLAYMGGYGIYADPDSDQFYITAVSNFKTVNALDFASAETYADNLVRAFVDHAELWLFGEDSTEVWQLSGGLDFPFTRFNNTQIETGCAAPMSIVSEDNTVFWLGDDGLVYNAPGYSAAVVSTRAIDRLIEDVPKDEWTNARGFIYVMEGHKFYVLTFQDRLTIKYNMATRLWSEASTHLKEHWEIIGSAGKTTDYYLGESGIVDLVVDLCQDEGGVMKQKGISAPVYNSDKRISFQSWTLVAEAGSSATDETLEVMLRVSIDGRSFGNERVRTLGLTGEYGKRAVWRNLGQARSFVFDISTTSPTPLKITNTFGMVEAE